MNQNAKSEDRYIYFGYGNNSNPVTMADRIPGAQLAGAGLAKDWGLSFTKPTTFGWGASTIVPGPHEVWGTLWSLTEAEIKQLDKFEVGYHRGYIDVFSVQDAKIIKAVAYFARSMNPNLLPDIGYLSSIINGLRRMDIDNAYSQSMNRMPFLTIESPRKIGKMEF